MLNHYFKKAISFVLVAVIACGSITVCTAEVSVDALAPEEYHSSVKRNMLDQVTPEEMLEARVNGLEIVNKITDLDTIQQMAREGQISVDKNGNLPAGIITYFAPEQKDAFSDLSVAARTSSISVNTTRYFDGRYFDDYDRYRVDGEGSFEVTYEKTGSSGWNTSMSGEISASGEVYDVAELKAAVSSKIGHTFGKEETKRQKYSGTIPANKYCEIKVWASYLVHEYTAKVGNITLGTGKTWKPNGLVIEKAMYNK